MQLTQNNTDDDPRPQKRGRNVYLSWQFTVKISWWYICKIILAQLFDLNNYCADDHEHVVLERKRNSISIKSKYEILMKLKSGIKRDLIISEYNQ